jgi:DNA-binding PadR family transcriptional regulator
MRRRQPRLFDELQTATITLSVLWALTRTVAGHTLTELEDRLQISSRKKAYQALERLLASQWVEKSRFVGRTKYQITQEGIRQLQRLAASTDGPIRRATALS